MTDPLKNHQTAAGHECKMIIMMVLARHKIQDKYTLIDFQVQDNKLMATPSQVKIQVKYPNSMSSPINKSINTCSLNIRQKVPKDTL